MPKLYRVTPHLAGGRSYAAQFKTATGKRRHGALGTDDFERAESICRGLEWLYRHQITDPRAVPADLVPFKAVALYFGVEDSEKDAADVERDLSASRVKARGMGADAADIAEAWLEARRWQEECSKLKVTIAELQQALAHEKSERAALERSMLARAALAGRKCPPLAESMTLYEANVRASMTPRNADDHISAVKKFVATLDGVRTLADVLPSHVNVFLDARANEGDPNHLASRRRHWRLKLSRLLHWAARTWEFVSPMSGVKTVPRGAVLRERGDVQWHSLDEVEAALREIPRRIEARFGGGKRPGHKRTAKKRDAVELARLSAYWQTLVATLGYAGLQLAELAWLRKEDLKFSADGARGSLSVTTVADPEDPAMRHYLKTEHRRREVNLHPTLLLPRLREHLASRAGEVFLFPMPPGYRRRKREKEPGAAERWLVQSLSTILRGHPGSADKTRRLPEAGLLPSGMNAKSLRRTFGSLLLRSGKSYAQVAAAMGNTEKVVRDHYARLRGCEVDVNF